MWGRKEQDNMNASNDSTNVAQPQAAAAAAPARVGSSPPNSPPAQARSAEPAASLGKSLKFKGQISGGEDLHVDGELEGAIELKNHGLTVGPTGRVHADVHARSITVVGHLEGNVRAEERIEVRKTGSLQGDVVTARILIEDGAVFRGRIDIIQSQTAGPADRADASPPPDAKSSPGSRPAGAAAGRS
jgi:cytoskeletal protein CcmA (bactofilin family)